MPVSLQEIKKLVRRGEGQQIEFKRKVAHPEKIVREIVAFANADGGYLLVGISDEGGIPGLKYAEEHDYLLKKAIDELCRPALSYKSEIVPIDDNLGVLYYFIKPSKRRPHYALADTTQAYGKAYIRVGDKSIQASDEMRQILKQSRRTKNIKFTYGENEKKLMEHFKFNKTITLSEFVSIAKIPGIIASRTLVRLCLANVLTIQPLEKGDLFTLKESF
ncbi:ATP-binding protein [uncultured Imperialibacter sp.]|uniref:AlbA family DNA-binding domain-containing protein n=1 Tax=uncultured Imperialibacter sp. TaxID=1672639 RepID=UPI0030D706D2|tara:strand:- start:74 stop:730 length:657 start_codon:yes stop_codon:yes gene_type:complete